ncbi:MAG: hypothetical protein IKP27_01100 [Paludibacteraceae bacterium]|nr:hypothetical protein [Paludibacteraceae bacterium]
MESNYDNILSEIEALSPLDYDQMKEVGLQYIQEIAHQNWTDFNTHDPGVTIWEALCFSLSDLAYRTSFEIKDLLTNGLKTKLEGKEWFHPEKMLSFNPLTPIDYRKLILETIPEIQNVWIEKYDKEKVSVKLGTYSPWNFTVNGLYQVRFQCTERDVRSVKNRLEALLNRHRNLCERFLPSDLWNYSKPIKIGICVSLEVDRYSDLARIVYDIYKRVGEYITPSIRHYTVSELQEKGKSFDEIFQGSYFGDESSFLGFIDYDELKRYDKKTKLFVSDIINVIMNVEGVLGVPHIHFVVDDENRNRVDMSEQMVSLRYEDENCFVLSPLCEPNGQYCLNHIYVQRNGFPIRLQFSAEDAGSALLGGEALEKKNFLDMPPIESKYRNTRQYYSFQNILPQCYRVGRTTPLLCDSPLLRGRAKQLKGYLSLFDQFLSDYLVRLSSLDSLLSAEGGETDPDVAWFHGFLSDDEVANISEILKYDDLQFQSVFEDKRRTTRGKALDHLLSRFGETFPEYEGLLQEYDVLSPSYFNLKENMASYGRVQQNEEGIDGIIEDKKCFLKQYSVLGKNRSLSTDVRSKDASWVYSGVERRILAKLGINNIDDCSVRMTQPGEKVDSSKLVAPFALHILEHILFLPYGKDSLDNKDFLRLAEDIPAADMVERMNSISLVKDPYSFHVTVVLPGWLSFTRESGYRDFVENVIREELPAHVISKICWVPQSVMKEVEDLLEDLYSGSNSFDENVKANPSRIKNVFDHFRNFYPCADPLDSSVQQLGFVVLPEDVVTKPAKTRLTIEPALREPISSIVQGLNGLPQILGSLSDSQRKDSQESNDGSVNGKTSSTSQKNTDSKLPEKDSENSTTQSEKAHADLNSGSSSDGSLEKATEKVSNKTTGKASGNSSNKTTEKVVEKASGKITEKVSDKTSEKISDNISKTVTEKVVEKASGKITEKVSDKTSEKISDNISKTVTEKVVEKPLEKATEKLSSKATEKASDNSSKTATEKVVEKPLEKATEKLSSKATEKASDNSSKTVTEKVLEKPLEKATEKLSSKATEKASDNSSKTVTEKVVEKPLEKATEKLSGKATEKASDNSSKTVTGKTVEKSSVKSSKKTTEISSKKATEKALEKVTKKTTEKKKK